MPNTYSQLYNHYIFSVQNKKSILNPSWQNELFKYMTGIIEQQGHRLFAINGVRDHVHALISMNPKQAPSDLMYHVKRSSTLWINKNNFVSGKFSWQEGFGVFSYGKLQIPTIVNYIENQQLHHQKKTFLEEYIGFLKAFEIDYDERYIFKPVD